MNTIQQASSLIKSKDDPFKWGKCFFLFSYDATSPNQQSQLFKRALQQIFH